MRAPDIRLLMSASQALLGALGPNLIRFSGEIRDKTVTLQWIIREGTPEGEIEDYRVVGTEILANYYDEQIEEEFINVAVASEMESIPALSNLFLLRKLDGALN